MDKLFYSPQEAMDRLGCSEGMLKQAVADGKLREFRDGGNLNFKVDEVDNLASARVVNPTSGGVTIAQGDYLRLKCLHDKEWVERKRGSEAVEIVAVTAERKILIVEQYRRSVDSVILELPAGICGDFDAQEAPEIAAMRELREETGYAAGALHFMSQGPSCAGLCNEITTFFLATDLKKEGDGGGVEDERITVHEVPLIHLGPWIAEQKKMADPRIWAGAYLRIAFLTQRPDVDRL